MSDTPSGETVLDIIEKRLIPNEEAKRARGEVFTPLHIVRELLDGVRKGPAEKGVIEIWGVDAEGDPFDDPAERVGGIPLDTWKNPDSKWLDPANGIGNFPFIAFQMLDYQLRDVLKDPVARRKHIVEKMLFMIEIDKGNVNTSFKIFEQLAPGATPNICCADTLKLKDADLTKEFGTAKFDVVMGNPPFQTPTTVVGKLRAAQHGTLWDEFVRFGSEHVSIGGFIAFIIPQTWRKPENDMWNVVLKNHSLLFLHILSKKHSEKVFKVSQRIDLFVIQNKSNVIKSSIIDENTAFHTITITDWPFLPNYAFDDITKILTSEDMGIKVIYDSSAYRTEKRKGVPKVVKTKTEDYMHPVVHGITNKGIVFWYSNTTNRGHFGTSKVLLNKNEQQYPYNDFEGKYGMSELTFGIPITSKEEGDKIVRAINTDRFKEIIKATKWGAYQTEYKMFKYFKPDFYKEFLPKEGAARRRTRRNKKTGTRRRSL
jgi:hypothetical protein